MRNNRQGDGGERERRREREGVNALEAGITVQNEHLPFDASNAVCASTSYFRFLV